jgi:Ca2+-binding RTX toxin-like protein
MAGGRIELRDRTVDGGIDPGPCDPGQITNDANAWIVQVFCSRRRVDTLNVDLGEREDTATIDVVLPVTLLGGPGSDTLATGDRPDTVDGGEGNDRADAGGGDDTVTGGLGYDVLEAGEGDDVVRSADGLADRVACGGGRDRVEADTADDVAGDCEDVQRRPVVPPADAGATTDDRTPPRVEAGGRTLQKAGRRRVRLLATSSERGSLADTGGCVNADVQVGNPQLGFVGLPDTCRPGNSSVREATRSLRPAHLDTDRGAVMTRRRLERRSRME